MKGSIVMAKKDIDWNNLGFGYVKTDKRYVSNFKNGAWDDGALIEDDMITISVHAFSSMLRQYLKD